jgi:hypothetical protein
MLKWVSYHQKHIALSLGRITLGSVVLPSGTLNQQPEGKWYAQVDVLF